MKIKKIQQRFWGVFYYLFARHLPHYTMFYSLGLYKFRYYACKKMFGKCGKHIKVGQGALIGSGKTIEMGSDSSIGKNCIVAAASVVNKSIPDNCVVGGNPIKKLGETDTAYNKLKMYDVKSKKMSFEEKKKFLLNLNEDRFITKPYMK